MNHEQVQRILSGMQTVDAATQAQIDQHLATCAECRQFAQLVTTLHADSWNPYTQASLSPEQKHDLLAKLAPQIRRNDMKKQSPHTNWATALAAFAVLVVISVYVFTTNQRITELQATVTTIPNQVIEVDITATSMMPTVPPPVATPTMIGSSDAPSEIEVTRIPSSTPLPATATPFPVETDEQSLILPPTINSVVSDPLSGSDVRRQAQMSSDQWVAVLEDRIFDAENYAQHSVTLREVNGNREYTIYNARENIGLGGLWVELLHFSADNRHFYFTPAIAWHGCRLFSGGGGIVQVDLDDGSTLNFENLTGFAHEFDNTDRVAYVIGHDVAVYDFGSGEGVRFGLPIATEETEVGGLVWQTVTSSLTQSMYLAATVAHNPCGQAWTHSLYMIDLTDNTVEQLVAPTEALQNFRPIAWQDDIITLENQLTDEQLNLNIGTGELTP